MTSDVTYKTRQNFKAALSFGSLSKVRSYFLRHPSLLTLPFPTGKTALHLAIAENRLDVVRTAVEQFHATVSGTDTHSNGLAAWAMFYRNTELAEYVTAQGGGWDTKNRFVVGEVTVSFQGGALAAHCKDMNDGQASIVHSKLSLKNLFRVYKQQTYRVVHLSEERSTHGHGLAYGLRKGYLPIEKPVLTAFIGHFLQTESQSSLKLVLNLVPDLLLDDYLRLFTSTIGHCAPLFLLAEYSSRISPDLLLLISRSLQLKGSRRALLCCQSKEMYSLLPDLMTAQVYRHVENECNFERYRCTVPRKPCKRTLSLLILLNRQKQTFVENARKILSRVVTECIHENGVIKHIQLVVDSGLMPTEKVSLGGKDVNLIVNVDMLQYHSLLTDYFTDFTVVFDFAEYPKVHTSTLLPAVHKFAVLYPGKVTASIATQLPLLAVRSFTRTHVPSDFVAYLDSCYSLENYVRRSHADLVPRKEFRKFLTRCARHRKLWLLFTRTHHRPFQRLPPLLTRDVCSYL